MAKDPIQQASSHLFQALTQNPADAEHLLGPDPGAFESDAAEVVAALQALNDALHDIFQGLIDSAHLDEARRVKLTMDQVAAVLIGINRAVVKFLDCAPDVAAAQAQIQGAVGDLDQTEADVRADTGNIGEVTAVLTQLATLVNL